VGDAEAFRGVVGYGVFFLATSAAQIGCVPVLLRWPNRKVFALAIVGNSGIILLYLLTRVVGIPLFGPEAGQIEGVGIIDVCATVSEAVIVIAIGALLLRRVIRQSTALITPIPKSRVKAAPSRLMPSAHGTARPQ
jgi:hypothetical protein